MTRTISPFEFDMALRDMRREVPRSRLPKTPEEIKALAEKLMKERRK